jgi:hypothetical protein
VARYLIEAKPVLRALVEYAVVKLFFLDDGTFELADARNIKWFGFVENDDFYAEMTPWMVGTLHDVFEAWLERKIKGIVASRREVLRLHVPVLE